jgi:hypothetical protein
MTLYEEITTDPTGKGYASYLPDSPGAVADLLNKPTEAMVKSRMITARAILAECNDGAAILDALSTVANTNSTVKWAMMFLQQDAGLDVGHPKTQYMLGQLEVLGALTTQQTTELKNMAVQPASRAEVLGMAPISVYDIIEAGGIE